MLNVYDIMWVHIKKSEPDDTVMKGDDAYTQRVWCFSRFMYTTNATVVSIRIKATLMPRSCIVNDL